METTRSLTRALPIINMAGTDFYVDTRLFEFREVADPSNIISMHEIRESPEGDVTGFVFDRRSKNVYTEMVDPEHIPEYVQLVIIPPLTELDPVGLARKYGLADDAFTKTAQPKQDSSIRRKRNRKGRYL